MLITGANCLPIQAVNGVPVAGYMATAINADGQLVLVDENGVEVVLARATVAAKYRIKSDGTFQLWNADQSQFHTLTVSGAAGAEQLNIAAGEV